jgi:hypothetical protein
MLPAWVRNARRALRGTAVNSTAPWIRRDVLQALGLSEALNLPTALSVWSPRERSATLWSLYMAEMIPVVSWWQRNAALPRGIESRSPFWDLRVIEFALRTPQWVHRSGGKPKMLLRGAMAGHVPEEVITREDKGVFDELMNRGLQERETARAEHALVNGPLAMLPYLRSEVLLNEFRSYCRRPHIWWDGLWRAISGGLWLEFEKGAVARESHRESVYV